MVQITNEPFFNTEFLSDCFDVRPKEIKSVLAPKVETLNLDRFFLDANVME